MNSRPLNIGIVCYPTPGGSGVVATELGMSLAETRPVAALVFFSAAFALSAAAFLLVRESRQRRVAPARR